MKFLKTILLLIQPWIIGAQATSIDTFILVNSLTILFDSDSYELSDSAQTIVDTQLLNIKSLDDVLVKIETHTDKVGSPIYNEKLSERRRNSIETYFLNKGISTDNISASHKGETELIDPLIDRNNRRGVIELYEKKTLIFLSGTVVDDSTNTGIIAEINLRSNTFASNAFSKKDGGFQILAPLGDTVSLEVSADKYFIEGNEILIKESLRAKRLRIPLPRLRMNKHYIFKNMLFLGNRSLMIKKSDFAMAHLLKFMKMNKEVCIEIGGHINEIGAKVPVNSVSFKLSSARALKVKNGLYSSGIKEERLLARGFGNSELRYPKPKNFDEQEKNRRVEVIVRSCEYTRTEEDDFVDNLEEYDLLKFDRKYNKAEVQEIIRETSINNKVNIIRQVDILLENNIDPRQFSYREILEAFPDLPKKK